MASAAVPAGRLGHFRGPTMATNEPLRRDLLEMARLDRVTRAELAASGNLFDTGYEPRMARVHERNAQRLRRVIESVGWPGTDLVGPDGAEAAWTILQHAIAEPDLLRRALPLLETAAREGRADPSHAAMLEDRIRFFEGRPQRYGTPGRLGCRGELLSRRGGRPPAAGRAPTRRRPPAAGGTSRGGAQPGGLRGGAAAGGSPGVRKGPGRVGGKCRMARRVRGVQTMMEYKGHVAAVIATSADIFDLDGSTAWQRRRGPVPKSAGPGDGVRRRSPGGLVR